MRTLRFKTVAVTGILIAMMSVGIVSLSGCGGNTSTVIQDNKPLILAGITSGTEIGVDQGLLAFAKSNPAGAAETAAALKLSISTDLIPYFKGGKLGTASEIQALLNSSLFAKVDPQIRNVIAAIASPIFTTYLPAPDSSTIVTSDQADYIIAFLNGVSQGCTDFGAKDIPKKSWIEFSK